MGHGNHTLSVHSKGNFLYSAATAQSTMDYSSAKIQEGVVDSPPSRGAIPSPVHSPSPMRTSVMGATLEDRFRDTNGSQRRLYGNQSTSQFTEGHKVSNYCLHSI